METKPRDRPSLRFGEFELYPETGELWRGELPVRLPPQPAKVLTLLTARPGQLVTRDELQHQLWDGHTVVDFEHGLNSCIKQIRVALADDADAPRYVETLPRRGYRFIAPVETPAPVPLKRRRWGLTISLVAALLLGAGYLAWQHWRPSKPASGGRIMLAVLPFDNLSGDPEQEYFSDGMTEEMIAQLGALHPARLGVIARTSAMRYKNTNKGIDEIGRDLGVDYVLEGSVRREAERVRITAELVQVSDRTHLWAESYERELADVFAVQREVAERIARSLEVELLPARQATLARGQTANPQAHEAYLKGRYYWNQRTKDGLERGLKYFQQALEEDPNYALAYTGVADSYIILEAYGMFPAKEAYARMKTATMKALELDETLAEAHTSLGAIRYWEWDWPGSEKEFKRAIELNPGYATAHHWYSALLSCFGRYEGALVEIQRARELDPVSLGINHDLGRILLFARRYDEAIEQLRKTLQLDPGFALAHESLGQAYAQKGMYKEAIAALQSANDLVSESPKFIATLGNIYARAGRREEALKLRDQLQALAKKKYVAPSQRARIYLGLGEKDLAFSWLEKAYETRDSQITEIGDPVFDPIRDDHRYQSLLRRMNLLD